MSETDDDENDENNDFIISDRKIDYSTYIFKR